MNDTRFGFDRVLFFGRSVPEYRTMFNFEPSEYVGQTILDCSAGPAALAASAAQWGLNVVACDPLYQLSWDALRLRADRDAQTVRALQEQTMDLFDDAVRRADLRRCDMNMFLDDFVDGKAAGRYVAASLPNLPFADKEFDLSLCGNFLFLYSSIADGGIMHNSPFDYAFHLSALRELCRVTRREVRLYPLNGSESTSHKYLDAACNTLRAEGIEANLVPVAHRDIPTATHLLSLRL